MLIDYARVSTHEQTLDLQLDALKQAGCHDDRIYKDTISSAKEHRPQLEKALEQFREGDTLVVWRLSLELRKLLRRAT